MVSRHPTQPALGVQVRWVGLDLSLLCGHAPSPPHPAAPLWALVTATLSCGAEGPGRLALLRCSQEGNSAARCASPHPMCQS